MSEENSRARTESDAISPTLRDKRSVIPAEGRQALRNYAYKSGPYTPLDDLFNKFWWTPVSTLLPSWVAPNLVVCRPQPAASVAVCKQAFVVIPKNQHYPLIRMCRRCSG